jgi:NADPH-dependent 2,4-dienoyl-CoA reductase/sulfur reductase-like enzyme
MDVSRGSLLYLAQALKTKLSIPVIGVGRLDRPAILHQAISEGQADFVAVARALIADPDYAVKALEGRDQDIRPCVACNFCLLCLHHGEPVRCAVNPYIGRDLLDLQPLRRKMKVMVVGGGPAGLSAAATAAKRGAGVKLYEKQGRLGGVVNLGQRPPFKASLQDFTDYLVKMAKQSGVEMITGKTVTTETVRREAPDMVIMATGATALQPEVTGLDSEKQMFSPLDVLGSDEIKPGKYLVVGGGAGGLELAEFLAESETEITVIEMTDQIGQGLHPTRLNCMLDRITESGVRLMKNTRLTAIQGDMVDVETSGEMMTLGPFNYIVFAVGFKSDTRLADEIGDDARIVLIGDAVRPRTIYEAVKEGFEAALNLED